MFPTSLDFTFHDITDTKFLKEITSGSKRELDFNLAKSTEFLLEQHYYVVKVALYNNEA
jgi:hypothetical protein